MKKLGAPTTVKLQPEDEALIQSIQAQTHKMSKSDIIRRAVRFASPKFLSGEVNILTLKEGSQS